MVLGKLQITWQAASVTWRSDLTLDWGCALGVPLMTTEINNSVQYIMSDLAGQQTGPALSLPPTIISFPRLWLTLLMHSGCLLSREHLPGHPAFSSEPGRLYLSSQAAKGPQALSDVDLEDEQHHPAALSPAELRQISPLHAANNPSPALPIPMPSASTTTPSPSILASPAAMFLAAFSPSLKPAPLPDGEGQTIAGYTLGGIIGYGGFSVIRRGFSASGGAVAVKIVRKSDVQNQTNPGLVQKKLVHEAEIWSSLSHEHILPLFSAVHTSYADFFVTLLCPAGSLYDILQRDGTPALPQDDAGMMFRQVVRGLRYLHEVAMYVHRDIKLENVLVDEMGVCRIGDFGMSRKIGDTDEESDVEEHSNLVAHRAATISGSARRSGRSSLQSRPPLARSPAPRHRHSISSAHPTHISQPGSLPYASPEILLPNMHPHPAQDMWALGVLLYALLTGRFPFYDSFEPRLQMKILHGKGQLVITIPYLNQVSPTGTFELPAGIGRGAERILQGCLQRVVQQRWTIAMVDEIAWDVGWGNVTPADSDDEYETHCQPSRSCSRPPLFKKGVPSEDSRPRPVREAASRRSASRAKRSLSRAPVPAHHPSYPRRPAIVSRHNSRLPSPSPTTSVMSSTESPFLPSPTSSVDRGRRPFRRTLPLPSRSPSPSIVPGTPIDFGLGVSGSFNPSSPAVDDQPHQLDIESVQEKRRRSKSTRGLLATPLSLTPSVEVNSDNDNDNKNISVNVRRRDNSRWSAIRKNEQTNAGVHLIDNAMPSLQGPSERERSRSCGYILRAPSSASTPLLDADNGYQPGMECPPPLHRQHCHHDPYVYDHEYWTQRRNKYKDSTPPTPATPTVTNSPLPASSGRLSASNRSHSGKIPITTVIINDFLKKKSETLTASVECVDVVTRPVMVKRGTSIGRGIGWS